MPPQSTLTPEVKVQSKRTVICY